LPQLFHPAGGIPHQFGNAGHFCHRVRNDRLTLGRHPFRILGNVVGQFGAGLLRLLLGDALGDVGGDFHHLDGLALGVQYRVIGRFQPDVVPVLGDSLELAGKGFALAQAGPESAVFRAVGKVGKAEVLVGPALDFLQPVAHERQEIGVGREHPAIHVEFDHRHGPVNGRHQGVAQFRLLLPGGNVRGDFVDAGDPALPVQHRVIGGLEPQLLARLGDPFHLVPEIFSGPEFGPELVICRGGGVIGGAENTVVLALQLGQAVTHEGAETVVGAEDGAVGGEFDNGQGAVQGGQHGPGIVPFVLALGQGCFKFAVAKHVPLRRWQQGAAARKVRARNSPVSGVMAAY